MRFEATRIPGVTLVHVEPLRDERGFFARTWCREAFEAQGLSGALDQVSISWNERRGTLRGMHYQAAPHAEAKLVRVTRGAIHDVALDLRPASDTYKQWVGIELSAESRTALYIPPGVAHGFQTLTDDVEILYQIAPVYVPEAARGVRYDDPAFGIAWPQADPRIVSERDAAYPDFEG
jgi:dTDP-4-dehydrorhamnose 3,5-epimerase